MLLQLSFHDEHNLGPVRREGGVGGLAEGGGEEKHVTLFKMHIPTAAATGFNTVSIEEGNTRFNN